MTDERKNNNEENNNLKPDPGTTHTTDPQKNMEGPVSSSMKDIGEAFDTNESSEEADEERDRKM